MHMTAKPIYIHGWSAASHAGFGADAALEALTSSAAPAHQAPFSDEALCAAKARLRAAGVSAPTRTESELTLLLESLAAAFAQERPCEGAALIFGTATSGLPETLAKLRERNDESAQAPSEAWLPMEMGRAASAAARTFGLSGPAYVVSTACTAGAAAIASAARLLQAGAADWAFAGGLDVRNAVTDGGFAALGALSETGRERPFSAERDGLILGEGGGMLLLSTHPSLEGREAPLVLAGWGVTGDAHHISAPEPSGQGAEAAVRAALSRAGIDGRGISFAILHGTATQQNDAMEAQAIARVLGRSTPCASLKRLAGHQLAGSGAFSAAVGCELLAQSLCRPASDLPLNFIAGDREDPALEPLALTGAAGSPAALQSAALQRILVCAFAFGGSNAALVIEKR